MRKQLVRTMISALAGILCLPLLGCATTAKANSGEQSGLNLVTTTPLLADLVKNVALPDAQITSLAPLGADPHTYEPSLRDIRNVTYADAVFSNHLLLEEQSLIRSIDANLPQGTEHIKLAESSKSYGAKLIQLVEDHSLDTIWLGMRVRDTRLPETESDQASAEAKAKLKEANRYRNQEVRIYGRKATGPGTVASFLTGTFGQPQLYFNSADGLDQADEVRLPTNAHTHMSWAFTKPGIYHLQVEAKLAETTDAPQATSISHTTLTFAVGIDPVKAMGGKNLQVLNSGHMDVSVNLGTKQFELYGDRADGKPGEAAYDPSSTIISVPNLALNEIPSDPAYRFLGRAGDQVYLLAQAVLGKHVHGEIDPHVWESVENVKAMVQVIRDHLIKIDPVHNQAYHQRAQHYLNQLDQLDHYIKQTTARIPQARRHLVTTHDAYGYFGQAYGLQVAGFVTPNPNIEPSPKDLIRLNSTLSELKVPAVFIEPTFAQQAGSLIQAAQQHRITVCNIYGDSFYGSVNTYLKLMAQNAYNVKTCLDPEGAPPPKFKLDEAH